MLVNVAGAGRTRQSLKPFTPSRPWCYHAPGIGQANPGRRPMDIIRDPKVYLVSRQFMDDDAVQRFLDDYSMAWETDTEVTRTQFQKV